MRNPNRLVGVALVAMLSLGGLWWLMQESRTRESSAVSAVPAQAPLTSPVTPTAQPARVAATDATSSVSKPAGALAAFKSWSERYAKAGASERATLLGEGLRLAQARQAEFQQMIRTHPKAAVQQALPYAVRRELPSAFDTLVERVVGGQGDLDVLGAGAKTAGSDPADPIQRLAHLNGQSYRAYVYGARQRQATQKGTPIWGVALGGVVAISEDSGRVLSQEEASDLQANGVELNDPVCGVSGLKSQETGNGRWFALGSRLTGICSAAHGAVLNDRYRLANSQRLLPSDLGGSNPTNQEPGRAVYVTQGRLRVLFMRVAFPDYPTEPISKDALTVMMNQVNQYYRTASYNLVQMDTTITPLLMLPNTIDYYSQAGPFALLADARRVSAEAGFNVDDYNLDVVGHRDVPRFDWGGLGFVGARGSWIQSFTPKVIAHELGHNLGLWHANASDTSKVAGPDQPNPPLPIDPDSEFGHHAVNAHGRFVDDASSLLYDVEYGDPYDWMGRGDALAEQFNSLHKVRLKWLPLANVAHVTRSETNRLYAFDGPSVENGRVYAINVDKEIGRKGKNRSYWVDHRQLLTGNSWMSSGVQVYWTPWEGTKGTSQLLDTTPGSPNGLQDAPLVMGRTFSDRESDIHITPTRKGRDQGNEWIDVVVQVGPFPGNRPPSFELEASSLFVSPGQRVDFVAADVVDADGDPVVYAWSYSDGGFGPNAASVGRSFEQVGHYVVRCEISDMKGGKLSRHVLVTVGSPSTVTVGGVVRDEASEPVADARVAVVNDTPAVTWTDTDGSFTVVGVDSGFRDNIAFRYGYETAPKNFQNPTPIFEGGGLSLEYLAVSYPLVSVESFGAAEEGRVSLDTKFRLTRKGGDLQSELAVFFQMVGTAEVDADYTILSNGVVTFAAGLDTVDLPVEIINDRASEGRETALLQLVLATNVERYLNYVTNFAVTNIDAGVTNVSTNFLVLVQTNSWPVPGWEIKNVNGTLTWFQTHPPYVLGVDTAVMSIGDNEPVDKSSFALSVYDETALEGGEDEAVVLVTRTGNPDQGIDIRLSFGGVASNGVDYAFVPSLLHFDIGQTIAAVRIIATDDLFVEGDETLTVSIDPSSAYGVTGDRVTLVVVDNDLPLITVNAVQSSGLETDVIAAQFSINRAGDLGLPLEVNYLLGGTATNGLDFAVLGGTATIPAGQVSVLVSIRPLRDAIVEVPETIQIQISSSTYYNVGGLGSAVATLYDESTPVVSLTASGFGNISENGGSVILTFTRTGPTTQPLTLNLAFSGLADRFSDYGVIGNQVTILAGSSTLVLDVRPSDDLFYELSENFQINLLPGDNYIVRGQSSFGTLITDNETGPLPAVSFANAASSVPENTPGGIYRVPVRFSRANENSPIPVVVEYRMVGGSATVGADFNFTNAPLLSKAYIVETNRFGDSEFEGYPLYYIALEIFDDDLAEKNETMVIGLAYPSSFIFTNITMGTNAMGQAVELTNFVVAPTNFNLGSVRFHTVTILDNDYNTVSVEPTIPFGYEEGQVAASFTFRRGADDAIDKAVNVEFSVTGSASPNTDYIPLPRMVTIPAGLDSVTLDVVPLEDQTPEIAESVTVRLSRCVGSKLDPEKQLATVLLVDNDGTIEFSQPNYRVSEGVGTFQVPVIRYGLIGLAQSVDYQITGGTAIRGLDFQAPVRGTLSFGSGDTLKTISLVISNDLLLELDETINIVLTNFSGGTPLPGQQLTTVIIRSDDTEFRFSTNHYTSSERTNTAPVVIERLGPANGPASVTIVAAKGTALDGIDFRATNRVVAFADGVSNVTFQVRTLDDFDVDGDKLVLLSLTNASNGIQLGLGSISELEIQDDDCRIEFASQTLRVNEFDGYALIDVRRVGGVLNPVAVDFRTADGTATAGQDFVRTNGTLSFLGNRNVQDTNGSGSLIFLAGESNLVLRVAVFDDLAGEGEENFDIRLSNARVPGASAIAKAVSVGSRSNIVVTIRDDETAGSVNYQVASGLQVDGTVRSLALQPDGRLVFAGDFLEVNTFSIPQIGRLAQNGSLDTGFNPGAGGGGGSVLSVASDAAGKVLLGGDFAVVDGVARVGVARLDQDGDVDRTFDVGVGALGIVRAVASQPDGKVVIGGDFLRYNSVNRTRLARLASDGRLDTNFTAVVNASIHVVLVQPDGQILIGGAFTRVNNANVQGLVRLNPDGSIDNTFKVGSGVAGTVYALAVNANGAILVGGDISAFNGQPVAKLIQVSSTGELDSQFGIGAAPNGIVRAVGVHASGKVYVGGEFTALGAQSRNRIARLRATGLVDDVFDPGTGANGTVRSLVVHPNSEVSIGGDFTEVNGIARSHIARIHGDDRLAVTGVEFAQASYRVSEGAGSLAVTLRRVGDPKVAFNVTVKPDLIGSTASAGLDYLSNSVALSFGAGVLSRTFDVSIVDDALIESDETLLLNLVLASPGVDLSGQVTTSITIEDNEVAVQLNSPALSVNEDSGSASIIIGRQGLTNTLAQVTLVTVAESAREGLDFTAVNTEVTFQPGETSKEVGIPLVNDSVRESSKTFRVRLLNPSEGVVLGLSESLVTILDTDREKLEILATALVADPNGNGGIDPREVVTLMVALVNSGTADVSAVTAVPLPSAGIVLDPGLVQVQTFGALKVGGAPSSRPFTFGNNAQLGASLELLLQLTDASDRDLGIVKVPVALGPQSRVFSASSGMNINDNGPANPYPSVIQVSGLPGAITKVTLTLDGFTHPSPADVDMLLVGPDGANSIVFSDVGGINSVEGLNIVLDESAANDLPVSLPLTSGVFLPKNSKLEDAFPSPAPAGPYRNGTLNFTGRDPNGPWSLYVVDDTSQWSGALRGGWKIALSTSGLLVPSADVGVRVASDSPVAVPGQELTYTVRVINNGPGVASNIVTRQILPVGSTFLSATGDPDLVRLGTALEWTLGGLAVGQEQVYSFAVRPASVEQLTAVVSVATGTLDIFAPNNGQTLTTPVSSDGGGVTLSIETDDGKVRLSWPASAAGVVLESTGVLGENGAATVWQTVGTAAVTEDDLKVVTLTPVTGPRFYRLRRP